MVRGSLLAVALTLGGAACHTSFPDEHLPKGAYARVSLAVIDGRFLDVFPYLEDEAQWAAHTIQHERMLSLQRARQTHPPAALAALEADLGPDASARDGAEVFVRMAKTRGWFQVLRQDLSGIVREEMNGDVLVLVTARGTRYPFRRRKVGIWGLTLFTQDLEREAEKATRDHGRVEEAARDYELLRDRGRP